MVTKAPQFPLIDALLLTPKEGKSGFIGVCTNTTAPGQVLNEINESVRKSVSVLGPLIVSRDGAERMILNSLVHPAMKYLILFSEESQTFSPSTNLLLALEHGIDVKRGGNYILNGKAASAHYPNLSKSIVDTFRAQIVVLPLFMYKNDFSKIIVDEYLTWLKPNIDNSIYKFLKEMNKKEKIYYDSLNSLIQMLEHIPVDKKGTVSLDPKDFQHLQPPKIDIKDEKLNINVPFKVSIENKQLRLDIRIGNKIFFIKGRDDFLIEYSLMKFFKQQKREVLTPLEQLLLGAELNRVNTELLNDITFPSFTNAPILKGTQEILLEPKTTLIPDKEYYYKIGVNKNSISVMCMAFDVCTEVFELRSTGIDGIFEWLAEKNRFEDYEMATLHRMDVGGQIGRAAIAAKLRYSFIQDFPNIFKVNTKKLPLLIVEGDDFLDIHRQVLTKIYTQGLTEEHGDKQKGLARTGVVLAVYRNVKEALAHLPTIYKQGEHSTEEMRKQYKEQLLRFDHDGDYSYGERTRSYFGFDQLSTTVEALTKNPSHAAIIQRFDPTKDMGSFIEKETGHTKYTHDPCLTHDIFFMKEKKLHSFHIARAHNTANAYPENIFGLHDAYITTIREKLGASSGDMYMLSSRANILLLTEEQRVKKILAEPSKPMGEVDSSSGPFELGDNIKPPKQKGVAFIRTSLQKVTMRPKSAIIDRLECFESVNTLKRAINYLKQKGVMHNNPILTTYQAGTSDSQGDHMVFFQANVFGGKIHATAVFMNHPLKKIAKDEKVIGYLATEYSKALGYPLGELSLFYVVY